MNDPYLPKAARDAAGPFTNALRHAFKIDAEATMVLAALPPSEFAPIESEALGTASSVRLRLSASQG